MAWGKVSGLYITLGSFTISSLVQTIWLWQRSRKVLRSVQLRDESIQLAEALPVIVE
jgi:hypothetical protein